MTPGEEGSDFEGLLEELVPGAGRVAARTDIDAPDFPRELGLEPRGLVARGATGWVFRAWDPVLEREVAVKISRPDQGASAQDAMLAEARRTAALDHPSVLPVHRLVVAGGLVCVEYRLAPDRTVEALLAEPDQLAERDIAGRLVLLRGPVRALMRAHALGLVHGDVHPGNLLLGEDDITYLLDWAGPARDGDEGARAAVLSGSPAHAAPEVLAGAPHSARSDVFSLGAVAWELCAGRPLRPRQRDEQLGPFVARWRERPVPALPDELVVPPGVRELLAAALAADPDERLDAAGFAELLDDTLSGASERQARAGRGDALLAEARETLGRYRELGRRLEDERTVVAIQRARVPGHAPAAAKRALWEAEDRLAEVEARRGLIWLQAVEQATIAGSLLEDDREARDMVAELWWVRMEDQAGRGQGREVMLAAHMVGRFDPTRRGAVLQAPCRLSLAIDGLAPDDAATVEIAHLQPGERRLQPQPLGSLPAPLSEHPLPAGRYLLTVTAPGRVPARYPVALSRGEHHVARVRLRSAAEVGDGWALVPGGPFVLGGDPAARQPMPRCRPTLGDLYVQVHPVTAADWAAFLSDLPAAEAARRAPGSRDPLGPPVQWWAPAEDGRWAVPEAWDPRWPIVGIDAEDAEAYAIWASERWGRPVRLPGEEEWEKAARGADGRLFPWGDRFDPIFAHMRDSRAGAPGLAPVDAFSHDVSPYGIVSMAGGVREWTASWLGDQVVVRGGSWQDEAPDLRCASRRAVPPHWRSASIGFRLVSEHPASP